MQGSQYRSSGLLILLQKGMGNLTGFCDYVVVQYVTLADDVFDDNFPGNPIFSGTLIIESLA